jgi:ribosomal protein L32E
VPIVESRMEDGEEEQIPTGQVVLIGYGANKPIPMHPYGYQICLLLNVAEFQIDVKDLQ